MHYPVKDHGIRLILGILHPEAQGCELWGKECGLQTFYNELFPPTLKYFLVKSHTKHKWTPGLDFVNKAKEMGNEKSQTKQRKDGPLS